MKNKIIQMVAFLKAQAAFTSALGTGAACRLYPMVAEKGVAAPFAVYNIGSQPITKDGREYSAGLQLFFEPGQWTEMIDFADTCVALLDTEYETGTVETDYSNDLALIYTTITFNIT